jgi:pentatricopeptide repeat protein
MSYGRLVSSLTLLFGVFGSESGHNDTIPVATVPSEAVGAALNHVRRHHKSGVPSAPIKTSHVRVAKAYGLERSESSLDGVSWVGAWRELEWTIIHFVGLVVSVLCMRHYSIGLSPVAFICIVCANIVFVDPNAARIDWILDVMVTLSVLTFFWYKFRKRHFRRTQRTPHNQAFNWLVSHLCCIPMFKEFLDTAGFLDKTRRVITTRESQCDFSRMDADQKGVATKLTSGKEQLLSRPSDCALHDVRNLGFVSSPSPVRSGQCLRPNHDHLSFMSRASRDSGRQVGQNPIPHDHGNKIATRQSGHRPEKASTSDDIRRYRHVIESCIRSRHLSQAEECICTMQQLGLHCSSSCLMLSDAYLLVKDFDKALHWLDAAKSLDGQVTLQPYNTLLDACAKSGAVDFAESVINHMDTVGVHPDAVSYNSVIDACSKAKQVAKAVEWVHRMKDAGVRPDVVSFSAVLNAYAQCGLYVQANEWLQKMEAGEQGVHPNVFSYNTCINAQVHCARDIRQNLKLSTRFA